MTVTGPPQRWVWLLPAIVALLGVLPSVSGQLVWDDVFWGRQIQYFTSLTAVLHPPPDIPDFPQGYFRPVTTLSYLFDLWLWGPDGVAGRHVSNVFYHAVTTVLVWRLAWRMLPAGPRQATGALAAALIFAAHPIHTESVCWVGARVDVLATLFTVASALLALGWRDGGSLVALCLAPLAFLIAAGAKEVGVAGLGLVPLVLALAPRAGQCARSGSALASWVPLAGLYLTATGLYVALRQSGAQSVAGQLAALDPWHLVRATGYYLTKLVWPWPQSNYVVWELVPERAASLVVIAAALALTALATARWWRRGEGAALAGLLWTGLGLAPSLVVAVSTFAATPVAERYLYLPSAGFALACGATVGHACATSWRRAAVGITAAITVVLLGASVVRSLDWSSNIRLWSSATQQVTTHGQPWVELGLAYYAAGDEEAALRAFGAARDLHTDRGTLAVAEYHAGLIHLKRRDLDRAEQAFRESRLNQPDYALAHYGLGRVHYERAAVASPREGLALLARSLQAFGEAIRLSPGFGEPRRELARVLLRRGDFYAAAGQAVSASDSYRAGLRQIEFLIGAIPSLATQPEIAALREELRAKAGVQR